jgi:hypothetical protein
MNSIKTIYNSDCLEESRIKLNNNFSNLYYAYNAIKNDIQETTTRYNSVNYNVYKEAIRINNILIPQIHNIRLSLDVDNPTTTQDVVSNTVTLHPYNGNSISLFSSIYKTWVERVVTKKTFDLVYNDNTPLEADTNFDVFLFWDDKLNNFNINFIKWVNDTTNTTKVQGVRVLSDDKTRRFIGCLRTTNKGTTETTFNNSTPKVYLWNYKNRVNTYVKCSVDTEYSISKITNSATQPNWCKTLESITDSIASRIYFLNGEASFVQASYQNYFESDTPATVYSGVSIDSAIDVTSPYGTACLVGQNTGYGSSVFSQIKGVVDRGTHFIQSFDASTQYVKFNILNSSVSNTVLMAIILC